MDPQHVQDEFLRLMRAIYDSLERESELQRQLRRTKESLMSVALKLQVAIKMAQDDETTISDLQSLAQDAKTKEIIATKQAEEAAQVIQALNIEINSLKRRLRVEEAERSNNQLANMSAFEQLAQLNQDADREVDDMLNRSYSGKVPHYISKEAENMATPFDKWKMDQFLFAPDTPAASANHDKHVVDMLIEASHQSLTEDTCKRATVSAIAKYKRSQREKDNVQEISVPGANDFENYAGEFPLTLYSPQVRPHTIQKETRKFYLDASPSPKWGHKQRFDHDNLARVNMWSSTSHTDLHTPSQSNNNNNNHNQRKSNNSSVKLKSLRFAEDANKDNINSFSRKIEI